MPLRFVQKQCTWLYGGRATDRRFIGDFILMAKHTHRKRFFFIFERLEFYGAGTCWHTSDLSSGRVGRLCISARWTRRWSTGSTGHTPPGGESRSRHTPHMGPTNTLTIHEKSVTEIVRVRIHWQYTRKALQK